MCDMYGEMCFSLKIFRNRFNVGLLRQAKVEKIVHGVAIHWLSGKESVSGVAINKEGYADTVLEHEKPYPFP